VSGASSNFAERVMARVDLAAEERRRQDRLGRLLPVVLVLVVGGAWVIALAVGVEALHLLIATLAWLGAVGQVEQHLSAALLGPFAPLPLIVSGLLFIAAILWVRGHQPDPLEARR
jgi:hypothetical protein